MIIDERLQLPCGICGKYRGQHIGRAFGCPKGYGTSWSPDGKPDPRLIPPTVAVAVPKVSGYDSGCKELALHFLEHDPSPEDIDSLSQHIQDAVEDWFSDHEEVEG